jgi:CBS domain-containing protein
MGFRREFAVTAVEGTTVKIKSATDTAARVSRLQLRTEKARVLAKPEPGMIPSGTPLRDALSAMRERGGEAILISNGRRLAGILTERDVLTRILGNEVDQDRPVDEFMTTAPHTIAADATLVQAMQAMEQGHFRNLPLIDDQGNVVGLLRQQDLLGYVAEAFPQEILNLPPRPHQQIEEQEGA